MSNWVGWKWTEEKPYPETLDTMVYVRFRAGGDGLGLVLSLYHVDRDFSNWFDDGSDDSIVAYKVKK